VEKNSSVFIAGIRQTLIVGLIAIAAFGPISGIVLDGFDFAAYWQRPTLLAFGAMAVSILSFLAKSKARTKDLNSKDAGEASFLEKAAANPVALLMLFAALAVLPFLSSKYWISVFILSLIYVLLGLGLNIVVGLAGLLDLGFVAFYAVGAYGYALGHQYLGLGFWTAIPFAAFSAACFGAILGFPVLRMHGDYLAIVTLGFGEIIRLVLNNWLDFTGGPNGVSAPAPGFLKWQFARTAPDGGVPFHEAFGLEYSATQRYIFIYLVLLVVVSFVVYAESRLKRMPLGRAWEALREDEIACRSLGLNHVTIKLSAFSMGAMIGGIAGVFFAAHQGFVNPASFTFFESALILAVVVLGGLGSTVGVILAALVLTLLPEALRDFSSYRVLIFGILMVLMMIWRPRGLIKLRRPKISLKDATR
jgi:branched-chain amino acid transport system permease protein